MKRNIAIGLHAVVFGSALLVTGCVTYYRVTDPASGRVYYTEKVASERSGAVKLKDARSKSVITLQNSEVIEISKDEYQAAVAAPAPAPAPAAPAAAPAAPAATPAAAAPAVEPAPAAPAAEAQPKPSEGSESK